MNLVESLIKADRKAVDEFKTGVFKSKRLAKILGTGETEIDVTIREIGTRRLNDIVSYQINQKGNLDYSKTFDAKLMLVVEGCVDPDLMNKELQFHFGCQNARELAEKLFASEVSALSDEISKLSGIEDTGETEEEIKN